MKTYLRTEGTPFIDVSGVQTARRRAERDAWIYRHVAIGLLLALLAAGISMRNKPTPQPCPAPQRDVMQLDPTTIKASPSPGVWL